MILLLNFFAVLVQGGDPTGTGKGGESIYGGKFEDECHRDLKHTGVMQAPCSPLHHMPAHCCLFLCQARAKLTRCLT